MTSVIGATVITFWTTLLIISGIYGQTPPGYSTALETQLRTTLFTNYEVLQRPSQTVDVFITFNLFTINELTWTDSALAWSSLTNYSNVRFLFSSEDYMWRPAVVIENSVSELEVFSDEDTLIRINPDGVATWSPGGVFSTYCEADISYYPLDTQECSITLSTWAYTSNEVTLKFGTPAISLNDFRKNGEWTLLSTSTYTETTDRQSQEYSRLYYTIKLRRRSVFHVLNTLFPVILMASLVVYVFRLPPHSGERIGMSLTVLLTYAVYLTLIADNIPQTSIHTSVLSVYLTIILILSTFSVIFTIYVLSIHFMPEDEKVSDWLQKFTRIVLVKIVCHRNNPCNAERTRHDNKVTSSAIKLESMEGHEEKGPIKHIRRDTIDSVHVPNDDGRKYSPQEIAEMIDRCLMRIYAVVIFVCTFICCLLMVIDYNS